MADRLWGRTDRMVLVALNVVALFVLVTAWSAVRDKASLADQTSWVAAAIVGLVVGAAGDAWFLLQAKRSVAARAAILFRSSDVVHFPGPVQELAARGRLGWWRLNWDRLLAVGSGIAGAGAMLIGWLGLSGVLIDHDQVSWILGGSFCGLWLLGVAATAWLTAVLRDQWSALRRIGGRLAELGIGSVAAIPAPPRRNGELRGADGIPSLL